MHFLEFPSDLLHGENKLRLVVYDFQSLKPTVELGVWQPETILSKPRFAEFRCLRDRPLGADYGMDCCLATTDRDGKSENRECLEILLLGPI